MAKRLSIIAVLFLCLFLIPIHCKLIDFSGGTTYITVTFDKTYTVTSNVSTFSQHQSIDLSEAYSDAEINPDDVRTAELQNIEIIVLRNATASGTTADAQLSFVKSALFQEENLLASVENVDLNAALNNPINPFSDTETLTVDPDGRAQLIALALENPPPTILFYFSGEVSSTPVDFDVRLRIVFRIGVET